MVLFAFGQFVVHAVLFNRKLRRLYNPGLATVVFGFLPLGARYLFEVYSHQVVPLWNWAVAVVCMVFFSRVVMVRIGFGFLADKNSRYPFAREEMERFDRRRHLARLGIAGESAAALKYGSG